MIIETAYPYGFINVDSANNILNEDALIPEYPSTPEGQRNYMIDLVKATIRVGSEGVIY